MKKYGIKEIQPALFKVGYHFYGEGLFKYTDIGDEYRFGTNDINIAYQFLEYLVKTNYDKNNIEVFEKEILP